MPPASIWLGASALALASLGAACGDRGPKGDRSAGPQSAPFATARPDDPPLVESWRMPAGTSVLRSGDLGSAPPDLARALMIDHAAAGISHRIATRCAQRGALADVESLALRFVVGEGGTLVSIEGDPTGRAATCTADALRAELSALPAVPAGAALMLLRFGAEPEP